MKRLTLPLVLGLALGENAASAAVWDTMITNDLPTKTAPSTGGGYTAPKFTYYSVANGGILLAQGELANGAHASPGSNQKIQPANHLVGFSTYTFAKKGSLAVNYKCIYNTPASTPIGDDIRVSQLTQVSCSQI